ncbi:hypothetical protein [uncultured Endozoicomonas sp.]|uniref:hypothetical protein n=1 Tax=uncultured Endozoicomonas sp. TaxID=432652 RepID=UPI00260D04B9|nr:hypothetical protein [uncultured Endozoicomonas sp.]
MAFEAYFDHVSIGTLENKAVVSREIAEQIKAFRKAGGKITRLPYGVINNNSKADFNTVISSGGRKHERS